MLQIVASLAARWYSSRWAFAAIAGCSLVAAVFISATDDTRSQALSGAIAAALFSLSWALFLMCSWFHPTLGVIAANPRLANSWPFGHFTPQLAAWFLLIFVAVGAVVVPAAIWISA